MITACSDRRNNQRRRLLSMLGANEGRAVGGVRARKASCGASRAGDDGRVALAVGSRMDGSRPIHDRERSRKARLVIATGSTSAFRRWKRILPSGVDYDAMLDDEAVA